ncbi:MAG: class I SAM-dependent methyltransferase [Lachnospiraceae bacterium]|nr:class I SAM-dependent methyltransferase [Lachnospiraceae bacterium]
MNDLEKHYNKFNEDKRLIRRHGQVEYKTAMKYIAFSLDERRKTLSPGLDNGLISIIDIGAGTGGYAVPLSDEGYDVTAVEYVRYNLGILKKKESTVKAYQGDARKLKRFLDNSFDLALLFGPMYHLYTDEDKIKALSEAVRVTKPGGYILVQYLMNEYSVLIYGFREGHAKECLEDGRLDSSFKTHSTEKDLYEYVRLEDIDRINANVKGISLVKRLAVDGATDYMRQTINAMDEETFDLYLKYHMSVCERPELLGASSHVMDILKKEE